MRFRELKIIFDDLLLQCYLYVERSKKKYILMVSKPCIPSYFDDYDPVLRNVHSMLIQRFLQVDHHVPSSSFDLRLPS